MRRGTALAFIALAMCTTESETQQPDRPSFFITSVGLGKGADLGGLSGADRHCAELASALGPAPADRVWRAYLSTTPANGQPAVNARDRIGAGPWYNAKGVLMARNLDELHGENPNWTKQTALNEKGDVVNGRGDTPNQHDILTGSSADGRAIAGNDDTTCSNWTSSGVGRARVGHHDKTGGGDAPTSWNSAHYTRGCSQENLVSTGGAGLFYCFSLPAS